MSLNIALIELFCSVDRENKNQENTVTENSRRGKKKKGKKSPQSDVKAGRQ